MYKIPWEKKTHNIRLEMSWLSKKYLNKKEKEKGSHYRGRGPSSNMTGVHMSRRRNTRDTGTEKRSCEGTTRRQPSASHAERPQGKPTSLAP